MGKIIAVANQKGGVGKTTTSINLSACLAEKGKKVLLVDMDPQGNATSGSGIEKYKKTVYDVILSGTTAQNAIVPAEQENLSVMPSNISLSGAEIELVNLDRREFRMRTALSPLKAEYDYIIIDCPPSLGLLTINALAAANSILIPIQCEYFALEGVSALMNTIDRVKHSLNSSLQIEGILMTMFDGRTNLCIQVVNQVKKHFKNKVFVNMIPRNVRLGEAPSHGLPINLYDKRCAGAEAYAALAAEVIQKNK